MTNKHIKRSSILVIKEVQIKTTMRYTPTRMAKIQNTVSCKYLQEFIATETLIHCWMKFKMAYTL